VFLISQTDVITILNKYIFQVKPRAFFTRYISVHSRERLVVRYLH